MLPNQYSNFTEHQSEFTAWLQKGNFDTFATFTTAKELSLAGSRRLAERFYKNFDLSTMFWAAEPFSVRKGYHFHALINSRFEGVPCYDKKQFFEYWVNEKKIGRCDFQTISEGENWTNHYITKYISKGLSDYDYFTPYSNQKRPEYISAFLPLPTIPKGKTAERTKILQKLTAKNHENDYTKRRKQSKRRFTASN